VKIYHTIGTSASRSIFPNSGMLLSDSARLVRYHAITVDTLAVDCEQWDVGINNIFLITIKQTPFTMKQFLPFLAAASIMAASASATIHTVNVSDFSFTPSSILTARVGDTIRWVWVNGSHTTTSGTIPAGATPWDSPITSTSTSFSYKITAAGAYTYVCTPHASMGMTGSFTAQAASAVPAVNEPSLFSLYPNPAGKSLHIELKEGQAAAISFIDAVGRTVSAGNYKGKTVEIATSDMAAGLYYVRAVIDGKVSVQAVEISH
jgi:plastocyanin